MSVFNDIEIRRQVLEAWLSSQPGTPAAHEEGGFILRDDLGNLSVDRWPRGEADEINVPEHPAGRRGKLTI